MAKSYKTSKRVPVQKCRVIDGGRTFSLALPYSVGRGFSIGSIDFEAIGGYPSNGFKPSKPLPDSWYVNLND